MHLSHWHVMIDDEESFGVPILLHVQRQSLFIETTNSVDNPISCTAVVHDPLLSGEEAWSR